MDFKISVDPIRLMLFRGFALGSQFAETGKSSNTF